MNQVFEIASRISTPLALAGFIAAVFFFVLQRILKAGLLPKIAQRHSHGVVILIIERLFILSLVALVLGFAGYVIATFAPKASASTPESGTVRPRPTPPPSLGRAKRPFSDKEAQDHSFVIRYGFKGESQYALLIQITASFSNAAFNQQLYLNSIRDLRVSTHKNPPKEEDRRSEAEVVTLHDDSDDQSPLRWGAFLTFEEMPTSTQTIHFVLGPRHWEVPIGTQIWQSFHYESGATDGLWHRAQAEITFVLDDPDWAIIRSARVINTTDSAVSLLELIVANEASRPAPLQNLLINARHPRSSPILAAFPDQWQELTLDWKALVEQQTNASAWTELGDTKVAVPAHIRAAGFASDYAFVANVPLQYMVNPKSVSRITIRVTNMPAVRNPSNGRDAMAPLFSRTASRFPSRLEDWSAIDVSININSKEDVVFPERFSVSKQ